MGIRKDLNSQRGNIQSIERALLILKFISNSNNEAGLTSISNGLGLSHSTTHNILRTLKNCGFVAQNEPNGKYTLGLEILQLAKTIEQSFSISSIYRKALENLSYKYNETTHLAVLSGEDVIYIDKVECTQAIRLMSYIGKHNPPTITGVGKVLLAYLDSDELDNLMQQYEFPCNTKNSIRNEAELRAALEDIRNRGYAIDNEEYQEGLWCVAVPIRNLRGEVIAALSISFPSNRIRNFDKNQVIQDTTDAANLFV